MFGPVTLAVHAVLRPAHGRAVFLVLIPLVSTIVMTGRGIRADSAVGHKSSWLRIYNIYPFYTVNHMLEILVDILVVLVLLEDIFVLPE